MRVTAIVKGLAIILLCVVLLYLGAIISNRHPNTPLEKAAVKDSMNRALNWVERNKPRIMTTHNPVLFGLLGEVADKTGRAELSSLLRTYRERHAARYANHPLRFQIYEQGLIDYSQVDVSRYPFYNLLMMYGYSCDETLLNYDSVKHQLEKDFCDQYHPWASACKTHHLLGILYFESNQCRPQKYVDEMVNHLAQDIESQLFFDPRVIDVYMQRVMLLYQAGYGDKVKHRWVQKIINAQNADGGWDNFMPLIGKKEGRALGFRTKRLSIEGPNSNFHATVQAILVLAYYTEQSMQ